MSMMTPFQEVVNLVDELHKMQEMPVTLVTHQAYPNAMRPEELEIQTGWVFA
jgi:hypothetical protein